MIDQSLDSNVSYKEYLHQILVETYIFFNQHLGKFGKVYIAGGACRDSLIGRAPKDYDIFILNDKRDVSREITSYITRKVEVLPSKIKKNTSDSKKKSFMSFIWEGREVQLIYKNDSDIKQTLKNFDYNINCIAFGEVE